MNIAIVGAFDRFNYGDLLFPLILEQLLAGHELEYAALRAHDLSQWGGKPVTAIDDLLRPGRTPEVGAVIVAGGEVLGAPWFKLVGYLQDPRWSTPWRAAERLIPERVLNAGTRLRYGTRRALPFVLASEDFPRPVPVLYNAVGGTSVADLSPADRRQVRDRLDRAAHVTVRDRVSADLLWDKTAGRVCPDSAASIRNRFPRESLPDRLSEEGWRTRQALGDRYFCFQVADCHARNEVEAFAAQLDRIARARRMPVLLLPIGRAAGHGDQDVLLRIREAMREQAVLPDDLNVFDIMSLIAHASAFAGTSLHGNITAMAYGVPHFGLTDRVPKLTAYLRSWALPSFRDCLPVSALANRVCQALDFERARLQRHARRLAQLAETNLQSIAITLE